MAEITRITMYRKDNFVVFDDTDSSIDYFHNYSLGQKSTIEWLGKYGAEVIVIHVCNNDSSIPFLRRIKQICKQCGYEYTDNSQEVYYRIQDVKEFVYEFILRKIKPSTFVILWPTGTDEDFFKSRPMNEADKNDFIEDLKSQGIKRIIVKEFKE